MSVYLCAAFDYKSTDLFLSVDKSIKKYILNNMNLVVDIGNTRTKIAFFENNELVEKAILETGALGELSTATKGLTIDGAILSATGLDTEGVENFLQSHYPFVKFDHATPIPIKNKYKSPETLGKDRLAAVIAAKTMFPKDNCLVIDAGTCLTYNFVTANSLFIGGNITPGLTMRLKAMHHFTAKLPEIERYTEGSRSDRENADFLDILGTSTETAMRIGAQVGILAEVEGFVERFIRNFGKIKVIVTGGDGEYLMKHVAISERYFERNLVLHGLNQILNFNLKNNTK
jgi:type III pantothenate kinase